MATAIRAAASWQPRKKAPSRIARAAFHQSEELRRRHLEVYRERPKPACSRGCSYCCYGARLDVSAPEALLIVEHQRERLSPAEFVAFRERVLAEAERVRPLNLEQRALEQSPCVLLDVASAECSIYEIRPLACRHHHSLEVGPCKENHEDPAGEHYAAVDPELQRDGQLSQFALQHALAGLGLDESTYELTNALALILRDEAAAAGWQKGQPVFESARLPSDEADRRWIDEHLT
jgi:Fe-S-cluster containining protein